MEEIKDIKEIQKRSLNILIYIDKICKENNIKYFLAEGTLLGAVRHKGFIPWDDDVDILMARDEYEKFLKVMDTQKSEKFKCLHYGHDFPNYFYRFAKVVDLETTLQEGNYISHKDMGIFVDVFPVDGIDQNKAKRHIKKSLFYSRMIYIAATKKFEKSKTNGALKHILKLLVVPFAKLFGWKFWLKKHEKFVKNKKLENYKYATLYSSAYGTREIFPKEYLDDAIFLDFEGYKFPAFKEYDKHLTNIYGDYMTPPPPEKQVAKHDIIIYKKEIK